MIDSATPAFVQVGPNTAGRDFVVGDIHGHVSALLRLLDHIGFRPECDRLFSVGDLIDRGSENEAAVELLDRRWFTAIRGNHEQMMLDAIGDGYVDEAARDLWMMNGGSWHRDLQPERCDALIERIARLPVALAIETADGGRVGLVHAEVPDNDWPALVAALSDPGAEAYARTVQSALWAREKAALAVEAATRNGWRAGRMAKALKVRGMDRVFLGHTPMSAPMAVANTVWLDTGVFRADGGLSIAAVDDHSAVWCWRGSRRVDTGWARG